jgi:hypothetical protein
MMETVSQKIERLKGTHMMVYFGDGHGGREPVFSTFEEYESLAICELLGELFARRRTLKGSRD